MVETFQLVIRTGLEPATSACWVSLKRVIVRGFTFVANHVALEVRRVVKKWSRNTVLIRRL